MSKIVFHMKGASRASICSWISGDIGVDAVDPTKVGPEEKIPPLGCGA